MTGDIDEQNGDEVGFHNFVTEGVVSYTARLLQLKMVAKHYHQRYLSQHAAYLKILRTSVTVNSPDSR